MALDYFLSLDNEIGPEELMRIVEDGLGLTHAAQVEYRFRGPLVFRPAPGMGITVRVSIEETRAIHEEELWIRPLVVATFRLEKGHDRHGPRLDMLRAVAYVLKLVPGDAVLEFEGELILLARYSGRVFANTRETELDDIELAALGLPYELADIPDLGSGKTMPWQRS